MQQMSLIRIKRTSGYRDLLRAYKIEIDGVNRGKIYAKRELEFEVTPGLHNVRMTIDWSGSPEVEISLEPGECVEVRTKKRSPFISIVDIFSRTRWIALEVESSVID